MAGTRGRKAASPEAKEAGAKLRTARRNTLRDIIAGVLEKEQVDKIGYAAYKTNASATDLGVALHAVLTAQEG